MLFYLTILNLAKFLTEKALKSSKNKFDPPTMGVVDACNHIDFMCKNCILNGLDNTLYNMYNSITSTKKIWEVLNKKYEAKDVGMMKLIVNKFLNFKMVNSRTVMSQVQEFQLISYDIHVEGMSLKLTIILERLQELSYA
jgi:hypothetical protein